MSLLGSLDAVTRIIAKGDPLPGLVLQKELKVLDRVVLGRKDNIQRVSVRIADFADTAALCELMD